MLYIVVISAAVYVIDMMDTTGTLMFMLAFSPARILRGEVWRLVTWLFCPLNNNLLFTALMLYFYYFIGGALEREWGVAKFTIFYCFGAVLNIIYGVLIWLIGSSNGVIFPGDIVWIVPNYLNLSMFFAFAVLFPDYTIRLFFFIPIKIKWLALINAALFLYSIIDGIIAGSLVMALLPLVALLNFVIICGYDLKKYLRPKMARKSARVVNFRAASKKAQREYETNKYRHKCAVCGKTDTDSPNLEFRYCSRCEGYHCFCIEHINNHVHFQ
jgi:membrane associated rhomboid family serine protease